MNCETSVGEMRVRPSSSSPTLNSSSRVTSSRGSSAITVCAMRQSFEFACTFMRGGRLGEGYVEPPSPPLPPLSRWRLERGTEPRPNACPQSTRHHAQRVPGTGFRSQSSVRCSRERVLTSHETALQKEYLRHD